MSVQKDGLYALMEAGVEKRIFPGAVLMVTQAGQTVYRGAVGRQTYDANSPVVSPETIFDLASVTKAIVTTGFLKLVDEGKCSLDDGLVKYFPALERSQARDRRVRHLLTHTGAMEIRLSEAAGAGDSLEEILNKIVVNKLADTEVVYGNINTFLLGKIIEQVSGLRLDEYLQVALFEPLGMTHTQFNPDERLRAEIQPTEVVNSVLLQGVVHDESSRALGGITGHAGLFSCADDLTKFLMMWVNDGEYNDVRILSADMVELAATNRVGDNLNLQAGLGWHLNNADYLGELFPRDTFFHPGFVGNIIAGNRKQKLTIVWLSNMVHPIRGEAKARRAFYRQLLTILFQ